MCASSGQSAHLHMVVKACAAGYTIHRGPYMSAHVLLNLLDGFRKCDKMRGLSCILSLFTMSLIHSIIQQHASEILFII